MKQEELRVLGHPHIAEIHARSVEFAARREQVQQVNAQALATVDLTTARCGGRRAPEVLPQNVRSSGEVVLDNCETPEGVPFVVIGRIDVHHPMQGGQKPDFRTAESMEVHMGVAPVEMPSFAHNGDPDAHAVTALDGNRYYTHWLRTESTGDAELAHYVDPNVSGLGAETIDRASELLASLTESIGLIEAAVLNLDPNGGGQVSS